MNGMYQHDVIRGCAMLSHGITGLGLDYVSKRIYWVDPRVDVLETVTYYGQYRCVTCANGEHGTVQYLLRYNLFLWRALCKEKKRKKERKGK